VSTSFGQEGGLGMGVDFSNLSQTYSHDELGGRELVYCGGINGHQSIL